MPSSGGYDGAGNLTSVTASLPAAPSAYSGVTSYTYDTKDQLTQEASYRAGDYTNTFGYDGAGNATTFRGTSRTFNANNQHTANTYDGNGNPTTYGGSACAFDPENRTTVFGAVLTAGYTGDGLRAWKDNGAGKTYFLYDGDTPVCEMDASGSVTAVNTFGAVGLLSRHTSSGSVFYTFDTSGNVIQRLDAAGAAQSTDTYDAFGSRVSTASGTDAFGFGGQWGYYTDAETGLLLCTHRYYDPGTGRWLTPDPTGYFGGINQYGYCHNNSINWADPIGYWDASNLGGLVTSDPEETLGNIEKIIGHLGPGRLGPGGIVLGAGAGSVAVVIIAGTAGVIGGSVLGNEIGDYNFGPQTFQEYGPTYYNAEHTTTKNGKKNKDKHTKKRPGAAEKKDERMKYPPPKKAGQRPPKPCPPTKP